MCGRLTATFEFREIRWKLQNDLSSFGEVTELG
jgi:hypothetical protein